MFFRFLILTALFGIALQSVQAQTPNISASNISFTNTYCNEATVSWSNGDGVFRLVIASEGSALTNLPADNNFYLSNTAFGLGNTILPSSSEYVVYNGSGSSVTVTGLKANTTYYFSVFEFNGSGSSFQYKTTDYPEASVTTENIEASFTINDDYQCENGNNSIFTASAVQTGTETLSYNWDFGDGNASNIQNPQHSFDTFGVYNVKLTVSTATCETEAMMNDTVAPSPFVSFTLDDTKPGNTQTQCLLKPDGSLNQFWFVKSTKVKSLAGSISGNNSYWYYGNGQTDLNRQYPEAQYSE